MEIQKVGVIGAGTMGVGVSIDLILHGYQVVLVDVSEEILKNAQQEIFQGVRFAPMLHKALPKIPVAEAQTKLVSTLQLRDVGDCDFVIENVNENWDLKETIFRQLDEICPPETCFGVNTSCISITKVGNVTHRPDKVVGMHFMNPSYVKPVIEVMQGSHTSEKTLEVTKTFLQQMNKEAIVVKDFPGFVSNRISHLFMNEAMWVVQDQVATAEQVDEIFKKCFGHKMGPLETADLIGLDTVLDSLKVLYNSYQDPKFRCCPLLSKMVDAGCLGRKSGKGFYEYQK